MLSPNTVASLWDTAQPDGLSALGLYEQRLLTLDTPELAEEAGKSIGDEIHIYKLRPWERK